MADEDFTGQNKFIYAKLIRDVDEVYEYELQRNPGSPRVWLDYFHARKRDAASDSLLAQAFILHRAVTALPRSYKLWKAYLDFRVKQVVSYDPVIYTSEWNKVNKLFERALILLHKMPRIWIMFGEFLLQQPCITLTRRTLDRAILALPLTQHARIWKLYLELADRAGGETALLIWRRYVKVRPEETERLIELLIENECYMEAVQRYIDILNTPRFKSIRGKGPCEMWNDMLDLIITHATRVDSGPHSTINVDSIVRSGIAKYYDQAGLLWVGLAKYWINRGDYEKARDIFEEAISNVMTVRDFTTVFEAYTETEECTLSLLMDQATHRAQSGEVDTEADGELDLRLQRFEHLMDRRGFLINDVLLRQNPHNVFEWMKRINLWGNNKVEVVATYNSAVTQVNAKRCIGPFYQLWLNYAKLYEDDGDMDTARIILEKGVKVAFRSVDELADLWCGWAEMELRHNNVERAMMIMSKAVRSSKRSTVNFGDERIAPQQRLHKSWRVWNFYADLVEKQGTLEQIRQVYERIFELRIATPKCIIKYAGILERRDLYEEAFKVYERGLDMFSYPIAYEIWTLYLDKAVERAISIERLRDLFEQAVEACPARFAKSLYLMYGALEEQRGLARHAMRIYERATRAVTNEERMEMFNIYINKSAENFGLTSTRPIFECAVSVLPGNQAKDMCIKFADLERRLGEIDRARQIYGHASQFCDPRTCPTFWSTWEQFEVQHGNEDTYKEMLRVRRSIQAQYNTDMGYIASQAVARVHEVKNSPSGPAPPPIT